MHRQHSQRSLSTAQKNERETTNEVSAGKKENHLGLEAGDFKTPGRLSGFGKKIPAPAFSLPVPVCHNTEKNNNLTPCTYPTGLATQNSTFILMGKVMGKGPL